MCVKVQEATSTDWKPYRHISLREWHPVLPCGLKQRRSSPATATDSKNLRGPNPTDSFFFQICRICGKHLDCYPIKLLDAFGLRDAMIRVKDYEI